MQLVLSSGLLNASIFPHTLPIFIGYPLILVSRTNLHVFATTVCLLTIRPTSLTFLPFTPLPISIAQVLTTLSSVVHLSVGSILWSKSKVFRILRPFCFLGKDQIKTFLILILILLGTLFLSRSAVLIMSLLSDPELNLTFFVWPTNCLKLNLSVVICFPQSFISCAVG